MASLALATGSSSPGRHPAVITTASLPTSSVEPPAQPSPFERLPNELLVPIAAGLLPTPPLTTRFALRRDGTWEFRDVEHQWADWRRAYTDLLAFSYTSRRMAAIVRPLLYHTIVIRNPASLVKLRNLLVKDPELRPWVREVTCLVNLGGANTIRQLDFELVRQNGGTRPLMPRRRPPLMETDPEKLPHGVGPWLSVDITLGMTLLKEIIQNAPNLQDLLLAPADHDPPSPDQDAMAADSLDSDLRDAMLLYILTPNVEMPYEIPFISELGFLGSSSVSSLRVYCHREQRDMDRLDRDFTFSNMMSDCVIANLASFTRLRTLELCCSSFGSYTLTSHHLPPLPQIENLRLYGSYLHEPRLVAACLACTNLQTLLVHFESSTTDDHRDQLPEGKTLSDALAGLAGTLRTLELVALAEGHYLTRGRERPRKAENHRLTCIPQLTRLESLTLDYRGLFGTLGILDFDDGERLCQLLPFSLKDFTLVCEWGTAKDWKQTYLANLDMMLIGVQCLCTATSPRLSSISLAIHSWPAKSKFHKRFKREMEEARLRCASSGIRFRTFDLLPSYQDEDDVESVGASEGEEEESGEDEEREGGEEYEEDPELEEEDEASEYYFSGDDEFDPEREARRPQTFAEFLERLGEDHGHSFDELFYAYHEDRWDEYLF